MPRIFALLGGIARHCSKKPRSGKPHGGNRGGAESFTAYAGNAGYALALPALACAFILAAPVLAQSGCPAPLASGVYATRCTGGIIKLPGGEVERDCPKEQKPARPMAREILRLVEKLRCEVRGKVVITSGYRSPRHNEYLRAWVAARDPRALSVSRKSRHMQGRAVDFYITGYSHQRLNQIAVLLRRWAGKLPKTLRGSRERVWIKVYPKHEGREPDNLHSQAYIHMELRR